MLSLRESHPLALYATDAVRDGFTQGNALYRTLQRFDGQVTWYRLDLAKPTTLGASTLSVETFAIPGKLPIHLERTRTADPGDNVALRITDSRSGKRFLYAPAAGGSSPALSAALAGADCVFFDGTFWSSDELIAQGLGERRAEDMAHWPVGGAAGSLDMLAKLPAARKVLIHFNNTNPLLRDDSKERAAAAAAGVLVASTAWSSSCERRAALSGEEFVERLRREGEARYHDHHPFHVRMHAGKLEQSRAPGVGAKPVLLPDAHPHQRRAHPLEVARTRRFAARGSTASTITTATATRARAGSRCGCASPRASGSTAREVASLRGVLPGVRFACDAYVELVRERSLVEAVASSLTEFFAPDLMTKRIVAWEKHYPWVERRDARLLSIARAARAARRATRRSSSWWPTRRRRELQERCVAALIKKTQILWHLLDCVRARDRGRGRVSVR